MAVKGIHAAAAGPARLVYYGDGFELPTDGMRSTKDEAWNLTGGEAPRLAYSSDSKERSRSGHSCCRPKTIATPCCQGQMARLQACGRSHLLSVPAWSCLVA